MTLFFVFDDCLACDHQWIPCEKDNSDEGVSSVAADSAIPSRRNDSTLASLVNGRPHATAPAAPVTPHLRSALDAADRSSQPQHIPRRAISMLPPPARHRPMFCVPCGHRASVRGMYAPAPLFARHTSPCSAHMPPAASTTTESPCAARVPSTSSAAHCYLPQLSVWDTRATYGRCLWHLAQTALPPASSLTPTKSFQTIDDPASCHRSYDCLRHAGDDECLRQLRVPRGIVATASSSVNDEKTDIATPTTRGTLDDELLVCLAVSARKNMSADHVLLICG